MSSIEIARYRHNANVAHNMAQEATDSAIAAIHEWLAQKYERLAVQCEADARIPNRPLPFPSAQEAKTNVPL